MTRKKISGVYVGQRVPFAIIEIDSSDTIADLKERITWIFPRYTASTISLYRTKDGKDNTWLQRTSIEYDLLLSLKLPESIKELMVAENELDPTRLVGDEAFEFPNAGEERRCDVHIVVKPPGLIDILKYSWVEFRSTPGHLKND